MPRFSGPSGITFPDGTTQTTAGGAPSGGGTIKVFEFDIGVIARDQDVEVVTDAAVTATSKLRAWQAGEAATGKTADENEMENFVVVAIPGAGTATFVMNALHGSLLQGTHRVYYEIG